MSCAFPVISKNTLRNQDVGRGAYAQQERQRIASPVDRPLEFREGVPRNVRADIFEGAPGLQPTKTPCQARQDGNVAAKMLRLKSETPEVSSRSPMRGRDMVPPLLSAPVEEHSPVEEKAGWEIDGR